MVVVENLTESNYPIIDVPANTAVLAEQLGTKPKFWFRNSDEKIALFKQAREGTGEDWAEKVSAELASLLDLPHADYELAVSNGQRGVASFMFLPDNATLIHGNELLAAIVEDYPKSRHYSVRQHTLDHVLDVLSLSIVKLPVGFEPVGALQAGVDVFVGYLMFDTWIANQDRHHENWAVVRTTEPLFRLAQSYDHASSLGRNESDEKRTTILTTNDQDQSLVAYVARAKSAFYDTPESKRAMGTLETFINAARRYPDAADMWIDRLGSLKPAQIESVLARIPVTLASEMASKFALAMLEINRKRILLAWGEIR